MGREQRLVFGEDPELYDRARPSYPAGLIDAVLELSSDPVSWIVDAGCGTGKAAVLFASRGVAGVGIEPDQSMAEVARRRLAGSEWRIDVNSFEDWSARSGDPPVDLLVSAQAWHWFAHEVRFRKAYSTLRPRGWLALWWNGPGVFDNPVRQSIDATYARLAPEIQYRGITGHPLPTLDDRTTAFQTLKRNPSVGSIPHDVAFGPPHEWDYVWSQTYSAIEWIDLLRTHSDHRILPQGKLEALLDAVRRVIEDHGGSYTHPYVSGLWAVQRL